METRRIDFDAFDLQKKKSGTVFLYFDNFYSLLLADIVINYSSFVIIYGNRLKHISDSPIFFMKIVNNTTLTKHLYDYLAI